MLIQVSVVDDEKDIRESLSILINGSAGFSCQHVYGSAEEALLALPDLQPDVVLMDIHLPGKSGVDCIRELKHLGIRS